MRFILASASASRRRVLAAVGVPFEAIPADIDEDRLKDTLLAGGTDPIGVADALAEAKALHVSRGHRGALVLGADQTLLFDGELISKCADLPAAHAIQDGLEVLAKHPPRIPSVYAGRDAAWNDYFWAVQALIEDNPPPKADEAGDDPRWQTADRRR